MTAADNTGMYLRYERAERQDVLDFCKDPEGLFGSEGFAEKIEQQLAYKDSISRRYSKQRLTASGKKKTYTNIYAHKLIMFVPQPNDMKGQSYMTLIRKWLEEFSDDYLVKRLVYCFRLTHKKTYSMAEVLVFSRLPVKGEPEKKVVKYPSDYYWNPVTKKRCTKETDGAVLRHKKGDPVLDKDGNKKEILMTVEEKDTGLFFFRDFEFFIQSMKKALKTAIGKIGIAGHISSYFHYVTAKKHFSKGSLGKVKLRNKLIRMVNEKMFWYEAIYMEFGEDFPEYHKQFYSFRESVKHHLYEICGSFEGLAYNLSYFQRYESYKMQLSMLERAVEERMAKFDMWIYEHISVRFVGTKFMTL